MQAFVRAFLVSRQADGLTPRSISWHRDCLAYFQRWLESANQSTNPTDWNPILIREYVVSLQESDLSGWTVTNRVQSVLAFLRWLHEEGLTETDISKRVKKPQPPDTQRQPLTDDEMRLLIKA